MDWDKYHEATKLQESMRILRTVPIDTGNNLKQYVNTSRLTVADCRELVEVLKYDLPELIAKNTKNFKINLMNYSLWPTTHYSI